MADDVWTWCETGAFGRTVTVKVSRRTPEVIRSRSYPGAVAEHKQLRQMV